MLRTHNVGVHDTGGGVQGVHSGVDPQLSNGTRQHGGSIQVSKGGGRRRVSQVISWHVNSLRESSHIPQISFRVVPSWVLSLRQPFTCTDVIEPFLVVVILSCMVPMSVARVGWYPTAEGIRPSRADTWESMTVSINQPIYFQTTAAFLKSTATSFHGPQNQPV